MPDNTNALEQGDLSCFVCPELARRTIDVNIASVDAAIRTAAESDLRAGPDQLSRIMVQMPHVLVFGPPGSGKSALGRFYANQLLSHARAEQWPFVLGPGATDLDEWTTLRTPPATEMDRYRYVRLDARHIKSFGVLDLYIYFLQAYGVIQIDDIHSLRPELQQELRQLVNLGHWQCCYTGDIQQRMGFTLVGTTTDPTKLPGEFYRLFDTRLETGRYTGEELREMCSRLAEKVGLKLGPAVASELIDRCGGNPAEMGLLTRVLSRMAAVSGRKRRPVTREMVLEAATMSHIGHGDDDTPRRSPHK